MLITSPLASDPAYLKTMFSVLGLSEIPGPENEKRILAMYAVCGHSEIHADEIAWCAACFGWCLYMNGQKGTGSLLARSYMTWGRDVSKLPRIPRGAACVWRAGLPPHAHINIALDDDGIIITGIGGNQSNGHGGGVTIDRHRKSDLLAARISL